MTHWLPLSPALQVRAGIQSAGRRTDPLPRSCSRRRSCRRSALGRSRWDTRPMTGDTAAGEGWLLLIYRVPSEPSRLRAAVWRRIKSLGAIYLQNSAAALPAGAGAERALRKLRSEILDMGGTAALMSCPGLAGAAEGMSAFPAARNDEYEEIVDRCQDFLAQVKKEHVAGHFTFAELEENEVDLVKLQNWFARVRERDVFGAEGRQAAEKWLADCEQALEGYAARVYAEEADI